MAQSWNEWVTALYQNTYGRLYRVAYRLTGSVETAEELVQSAFLLALFDKETLLAHPKPEAWLMRTVGNLVRNERRRLSHTEISLETLVDLSAPEAERGIEDLLPAGLSPGDRQVLMWRFEQQLDYAQMADRLGISETGCRSRVSRALERCRKLLENNVRLS